MFNPPLVRLWIEGQATTTFISPKFTVPRTQRFKLQSIYWPNKTEKVPEQKKAQQQVHIDALKISKMIDEEERQERGSRSRGQTMHSRPNTSPHFHRLTFRDKSENQSVLTPQSRQIVDRLFVKNPKGQSPRNRDKYGFRNWQIIRLEDQTNDDKLDKLTRSTSHRSQRAQTSSKGFSKGKRIDLSRPQNFYPGPGTYRVVRYLDHLKKLRSSK